jgi:hypothetical protein
LIATLSHFLELELELELELLGSRHNANLIEDEADALRTRVRAASDTRVSNVPFSVARGPPDGAGE